MSKKKNKLSNNNQKEVVDRMMQDIEKSKKRGKRKKGKIIIALVVIAAIVLLLVKCSLGASSAVVVTTTNAIRGDLQETINTSGRIVSEETKVVFSPITGTIDKVNVAAGDAVAAGDLLISYNMEEMEDSLTKANLEQKKSDAGYLGALANDSENQARLTEADTNLSVLNQQIADNKSYLKTLQEALNKNQRDTSNSLASESLNLNNRLSQAQQELEKLTPGSEEYQQKAGELQELNAQVARNSYLQSIAGSSDYVAKMQQEISDVQDKIAAYEEYKAKMESQKSSSESTVMDGYAKTQQEADHELAGLSYKEAQSDYEQASQGICASFDGIVTECSAVEGATVPTGTHLLTLESSNQIKISFQASKQDLTKLVVGQKATITISGNTYQGTVSKINRMATVNESNTPMVGAEVHIENPDDKIILGMDAKLEIQTGSTQNALLIPVEAINADRDGDFLYVVENGMVVRKPVTCGISSDTYTEILDGISEDDQIILTAYGDVEEGMAVNAVPKMQ